MGTKEDEMHWIDDVKEYIIKFGLSLREAVDLINVMLMMMMVIR